MTRLAVMGDPKRDREPAFSLAFGIRTTERARTALRRATAELSALPWFRFKGRSPSQEAVISATWLLVEAMAREDPAATAAALLTHLKSLEAEIGAASPRGEEGKAGAAQKLPDAEILSATITHNGVTTEVVPAKGRPKGRSKRSV